MPAAWDHLLGSPLQPLQTVHPHHCSKETFQVPTRGALERPHQPADPCEAWTGWEGRRSQGPRGSRDQIMAKA